MMDKAILLFFPPLPWIALKQLYFIAVMIWKKRILSPPPSCPALASKIICLLERLETQPHSRLLII